MPAVTLEPSFSTVGGPKAHEIFSGAAWWTLGFETTGPTSLLHSHLEATATLVFAQDLPEGIELGTENSMSYMEWLRRRSGRTARSSK